MNKDSIIQKFGDFYSADRNTFKMGIDQRITKKIAERFKGKNVIETCTGGGFTSIALASTASKVTTIEINRKNQEQAIANVTKASLSEKVKFIFGNCLDEKILPSIGRIDAAFLDPDWADTGPNHVYKFKDSNTNPPADILLKTIMNLTPNVALILPPFVSEEEFDNLPPHEFQRIYLEKDLALYCLYFGNLIKVNDFSELYV